PSSIQFQAAETRDGLTTADYDQSGAVRAYPSWGMGDGGWGTEDSPDGELGDGGLGIRHAPGDGLGDGGFGIEDGPDSCANAGSGSNSADDGRASNHCQRTGDGCAILPRPQRRYRDGGA